MKPCTSFPVPSKPPIVVARLGYNLHLQTVYATARTFGHCYIVYLNKEKCFTLCLLFFLTITAKLVHAANIGAVVQPTLLYHDEGK
jgi:hypothetical protein